MSDDEAFFIGGDDEEFNDEATEIYKNSFLYSVCPLKRGDIIRFRLDSFSEERNFGKFIFDGEKLIALDMTIDEYGNLPEEFKVINEFPILYFTESITHNNIVYSDIKDVKLKELNIGSLDNYSFSLFSFTKNDTKYALFVFRDDSDPINIEDVKELIKNNYVYYAGVDTYEFLNEQIEKIHKEVLKNGIQLENILGLNIR
jgi:hypothetical protein